MTEVGSSDGAVLAVDLGGTSLKGAVVDSGGRVRRELVRPTPVSEGPEAVVAALEAAVAELASGGVELASGGAELASDGAELASDGAELRAVAAVVPGVVDVAAGRIVFAGNLGLREVPVRERLAALTGLPTVVEHDVRAAGVAERTIGAARGSGDHIIVVCGTGVAAAVVSGGEVVGGAHGVAGEFGHIPVWPDGELCECGQRGCLERYASAAAIARHYVEYGGEAGVSAREIAARRASDPAAARAWAQACKALAVGLAGAAALLDPELIVIAGGLSEAGPALLDPVRAEVTARLSWRAVVPRVCGSALGARAGVMGAAVLGWRQVTEKPSFENWYSPISS